VLRALHPAAEANVLRTLQILRDEAEVLDGLVTPEPDLDALAALPPALEETPSDTPDEIVVIGGGWRLPDLGSDWRDQQDERRRLGKSILPLYDPEHPVTFPNTFVLNTEQQRVGYIELFRFKVGKKPKD
jgi:hypothetical protein